jgi:hypothetical protein
MGIRPIFKPLHVQDLLHDGNTSTKYVDILENAMNLINDSMTKDIETYDQIYNVVCHDENWLKINPNVVDA